MKLQVIIKMKNMFQLIETQYWIMKFENKNEESLEFMTKAIIPQDKQMPFPLLETMDT